ncbi:MAG: phosphatidylserine decarboxylase [Candidatus Pelagisphaera sp.]|jgi:phosphatidylserine decarboxylase
MSRSIQFYNRYTGEVETETIYGESYLRWTYENPFGRLALNLLVKRSLFNAWYGWRMDRPASRSKVEPFIEQYGIDMGECRESGESFKTFNGFFYRKLTEEARPIASGEGIVNLPADGRHMAIPDLSQVDQVYVKGQGFELGKFLGSSELAERFSGGSVVISRLCPVDYHRFHSPVAGTLVEQREIDGSLFSVSPIALCRKVGYLWENKRVLTTIQTEAYGLVAFVAIGATCVGRIHMTRAKGTRVERGEELGYFAFGGSCVATVFEKGRVTLASDLIEHSSRETEVYAKMGDRLGTEVGD